MALEKCHIRSRHRLSGIPVRWKLQLKLHIITNILPTSRRLEGGGGGGALRKSPRITFRQAQGSCRYTHAVVTAQVHRSCVGAGKLCLGQLSASVLAEVSAGVLDLCHVKLRSVFPFCTPDFWKEQ